MQLNEGEKIAGFELIEHKQISEIAGIGRIFYHESSGVTVISLENKDSHKVFSINFLTLPDNNRGAAHIVEHAVCCASKKYPLKETFTALGQGSISTTMNACTYPDRTMYYVATPHEKDLMGIAEVYMDLVFHPCLKESSQYFLQEGWHYDISDIDESLEVSGVVYHEMLGEYGEASTHLLHCEMNTLFPDTIYQYDSGGIPEEIIELTEAEFLNFYDKHYTGANAIITLYGDMNIESILKMLDQEVLKEVEKGNKVDEITSQMAFEKPQYTMSYYPTQLKNAPTLLSLSFVVGESTDCELRLAFEILEHMLIRSTASPLLKALIIEQNLGQSLSEGGYDSCRKQPVFTITLKGSNKEKALLFEETILKVLNQLAEEGIDYKLIDAAIETLEFELRETDASYEPIGILYSEMVLSSYLYGGDAFAHLSYKDALSHIKKLKHQGYFEGLIKKYLLKNTHRSLTVLVPNQALQIKKEQQLINQLAEYKSNLNRAELEKLLQINEALQKEQLKENDEEELKKLPHLTLKDMPSTLPELKLESMKLAGCDLLYHEEATKDIIYIHFLWDAQVIPREKLNVLGLFAHLFSYVGTTHHTYSEIENAINTFTGGMHCAIHAYHLEIEKTCKPVFKLSCKVLFHQIPSFISLMNELLSDTHFREKEKLRELIGHIVYELERSFGGAPEYRASQRLYTYLSEQGVYEDEVAGIAFYQYIKGVYKTFDTHYDTLVDQLQDVMKELMQQNNLKLSVTAPKLQKEAVLSQIEKIITKLPRSKNQRLYALNLQKNTANEGFFNGQEGQAVAQGFRFTDYGYHYQGQYEVVANVLENTYLWDRIRLQGGAYGCDIVLSKEGYLVISSYCDPHINKTLETFKGIGTYLRQLKLDHTAIERAIISTMGAMIAPTSVEQKSEQACMYFMTGMTQEKRQAIYSEIRKTTLDDFHQMADLFDEMARHGYVCVFGNKKKLLKHKNVFSLIDLNS